MYKAVFSDVDGTLLDNQKKVSERTQNAINNAIKNGINVVICSGRQRSSAREIKELCKMSRYVICTNGAEIYDCETEEVLYKCCIDYEVCKMLYDFAVEKDMLINFCFGSGRATNKKEFIQKGEIELDEDIEVFLGKNEITQITIGSVHQKHVDEVKEMIEKNPRATVVNEFRWDINDKRFFCLHCTNIGVSKGNAMAGLCKYLHIDIKDAVAIGDDMNDISMIKMAGLGVAMGNASEDIRKIADMVTTSNEDDGVGRVLEKIIEEK